MKNRLIIWQLGGFLATSIGGTFLHFLYDLTKSEITAAFSAVNESTWEHMKLLFFPMFIYAIIQSRFFKNYKSYWCIKLIGILVGLVIIPVLFYTYNGVFGKSPDFINIAIFFISAAVSYFIEYRLFMKNTIDCKARWLCFMIICLIGALFILFTFITPKIPLFKDPITGGYGLMV